MKFTSNLNFPQKSILGFKILTSFQSSIACYLLLLMGKFLISRFGFSQIQTIAGAFFNIILNLSITILITNIIIKRKQLQKISFIFLNSLLFLYLPLAIISILKNMMYLIIIWF